MAGTELLIAAFSISAATSLASGVMGYMQGQFQADMAEQTASMQSKIALQNSDLAMQLGERNAGAALGRAASQERLTRRDRMRRIAHARAAFGAMGTQLEGTPMAVLSDAIQTAELDAHLSRHQGVVDASNARLQADLQSRNHELQSAGALFTGAANAEMFRSQAFGSLLGGLGEAAGQSLKAARFI